MKMTVLHVFFLVLVMWAVHCHGRAYETESIIYNNTQQPYKENMNTELLRYRSFFLVMLWQYSYHSQSICNSGPVPNYFIVHGLWPQPDTDCRGVSNTPQFDVSQLYRINGLVNKLNAIWPNLGDEGNVCFWEYEYRRHGSCFFRTTAAYFQSTVGMLEQIRDLNNWTGRLHWEGIRPGTSHLFGDLKQKISAATGFLPRLQCQPSNRLYQIHFCVDERKRLISCSDDASIRINCVLGSRLIYLPSPNRPRRGP